VVSLIQNYDDTNTYSELDVQATQVGTDRLIIKCSLNKDLTMNFVHSVEGSIVDICQFREKQHSKHHTN